MKQNQDRQADIRLGTHGENYGNWMSTPVFYMVGGLLALAVLLAALSFAVFRLAVTGILFAATAVLLLALLFWISWIRRQYAFGGGGVMERVHKKILSQLDYDGQGALLDKTTPRLIQFYTFKNAVNPPFLGGFLFSSTVAA